MKRTLLDILVDAGEAYLSMVGSNFSSYPYSYDEHKHEYDDNTPSSINIPLGFPPVPKASSAKPPALIPPIASYASTI